MEILSINNQFHVVVDNKVLGSFQTEKEAEAFKNSCIRGDMKELTEEEKDRLLTVEQVEAGESLAPTFTGNHVVTHSDSPTIEAAVENDGKAVEEESTL